MARFGYWKVSDIKGHAFIEDLVSKDGCVASSVALNGDRIDIDLQYKGGKTIISADHSGATVDIELVRPPLKMERCEYFGDPEMYVNMRFPITIFTHQTTEHPIEMTLDEVEKKLGHKVVIISEDK